MGKFPQHSILVGIFFSIGQFFGTPQAWYFVAVILEKFTRAQTYFTQVPFAPFVTNSKIQV